MQALMWTLISEHSNGALHLLSAQMVRTDAQHDSKEYLCCSMAHGACSPCSGLQALAPATQEQALAQGALPEDGDAAMAEGHTSDEDDEGEGPAAAVEDSQVGHPAANP